MNICLLLIINAWKVLYMTNAFFQPTSFLSFPSALLIEIPSEVNHICLCTFTAVLGDPQPKLGE